MASAEVNVGIINLSYRIMRYLPLAKRSRVHPLLFE